MLRGLGFRVYRQLIKRWLPRRIEPIVTSVLRTAISSLREQFLPPRSAQGLDLGGIVYTSIFNPNDGRKNWEDMMTAFLCALRDCDDATLVLKLISSSPAAIHRVISFYRRLDVSHRCRLVLIPDFLSEADMLQLARVSAYYLTTTRAEGNCLPLMNYLAAGGPGFRPRTRPLPTISIRAWICRRVAPGTGRLAARFAAALADQLAPPGLAIVGRADSSQLRDGQARSAAYQAMAAAGQEKMREWAHPDAVWRCLQSAVQVLRPNGEAACQSAPSNALPAPPMATAKKLHQDSPLPQAGEVPGVKAAGLEASSRLGRVVGPSDGERRLSAGAGR